MSTGRQVTSLNITVWIIAMVVLSAASCTVPKRYQKYRPFVYDANIQLHGDVEGKSKQALKEALTNQLDDSLRVGTVVAVRAIPPFFYNRLSKPPIFDSIYITRSETFMTALLNAQGYFHPDIKDTFRIDTVRDQYRVTVDFDITPGILLRLDSVGYDMRNPELQALAVVHNNESILKKNEPYSLQKVSAELDRLLNLYRNNGYYKLSKEDLFAEHDTVVTALIDPNLDPFEQLQLLDSLQKAREKPTITVVFKQRNNIDSLHLEKYHIGEVSVYPDLTILRDTSSPKRFSDTVGGYHFHYNTRRFKLPFIARNIDLKEGNLYRVDDYFNTINTFTSLGAWQQVNIDLFERGDSSRLIDARVKLYPARKQSLNIDVETSRNASDVLTTGSLFGIGVNLGLTNRNAFRESIQTNSNVRFGVELGSDFVQTVQTSVSHSIYIPKFILPGKWKNLTNPRTIVNLNASYTDRRDFLGVRSALASWGYEWAKSNHIWQVIPFNFEYTNVIKTDSFLTLEKQFPSLRFAFNDGLIISAIGSYTSEQSHGNHRALFRAKVEQSGGLTGFIRNLDRGDLQRFIKTDIEYRYFIQNKASTWAFRVFGGYGYSYGIAGDSTEQVLPFFKAYYGGGPYTMRAWRVRQLGPGSNRPQNDTVTNFDRYGDIKLELNAEYRFDIGRIFGIKVQSALFTDIGNVWLRNTQHNPQLKNAEFRLSRLYKDIAVGAGTSLRFDFDFFLIRFDWAYKLKNPLFANINDGWFHSISLNNGQFQLGIGYPF